MMRLRATRINHLNLSGLKMLPSGMARFPLPAVSLSALADDLPFAVGFIFGFSGIELKCLK